MTYHIITIGCQMNKSDSERLAGFLEEAGFKENANPLKADFIALNTCGVRRSAEDRVYGLVGRLRKNNPKAFILVTGCLSQRPDVISRLKKQVDVFLPMTKIEELKQIIKADKASCPSDYLSLKPKYQSNFSAFVPIGNGCNNFCTYCVVPYARGREKYRSALGIIEEIKNLLALGYKEITLIAQNVNSYQSSLTPKEKKKLLELAPDLIKAKKDWQKTLSHKVLDFSDLLHLVGLLPENFWLRFATSHPKDMKDKLIKELGSNHKLCEYVHLPAQAGDDGVLKAMNRNYNIKHYKALIRKIRRSFKANKRLLPVAISTDIIVGFPGESQLAFKKTIKLFKEISFDMAYVACYSPRYGTVSFNIKDDVPKAEKKKREEDLFKELRRSAKKNNAWYKNKVVEILVESKNSKGEYFGKTRTSKMIRLRGAKRKIAIGDFVFVKVKKVEAFGLEAELA